MTVDAKTGRTAANRSVVPVQVCFTPAGLKSIDAAAKRAGVFSRSQFVRQAVAEYLQRQATAKA
jgi:metal-responsive CopG/Arc/MetJ family transcriptional regulator